MYDKRDVNQTQTSSNTQRLRLLPRPYACTVLCNRPQPQPIIRTRTLRPATSGVLPPLRAYWIRCGPGTVRCMDCLLWCHVCFPHTLWPVCDCFSSIFCLSCNYLSTFLYLILNFLQHGPGRRQAYMKGNNQRRTKKFREEYRNKFPFMKASRRGESYAFCTICRSDMKIASMIANHLPVPQETSNDIMTMQPLHVWFIL